MLPLHTYDSPSELVSTLENSTLFEKNPEYKRALQVAAIPERVVSMVFQQETDVRCCADTFGADTIPSCLGRRQEPASGQQRIQGPVQ